jgi:exocyst complex component 7
MQSAITVIKKDLPRFTFLALCLFTLLQPLQAQWDNSITVRVTGEAGGEFKEILTNLKGICVRSFPEVLVDIQTAALGTGPGGREVGTSVAPITRQVC